METDRNSVINIRKLNLPHKSINVNAGAYSSIAHLDNGILIWGKFNLNSSQSDSVQLCEKPQLLQISVDNISAGCKHAFAWSQHQVYCWGSNQVYELGLEQEKEYGVTISGIFSEAIQAGIKIKQISCGESHSLAVLRVEDQQGVTDQLFGWGDSKNYQLALDSTAIIPYPVEIEIPEICIKSIYSRSDYNILLSQEGECYSWGSNIFGRIGCPGVKHSKIPTQIKNLTKIRQIGIGLYHCAAVSMNGEGYSWGHGMQGQLGINQILSQSEPKLLDFSQTKIEQISCGQYHTLVLGQNGRMYSCGSNAYAGLGHEATDNKKRCKKLSQIEYIFQDRIKKIVCGNRHNLVLTMNGQIYSWGNNKYGQLGPRDQKQQQKLSQQNQLKKDNKQNENTTLQKLTAWRIKYENFKAQKQKEQAILMEQFNQILASLKL